jgi:hypothetical protein
MRRRKLLTDRNRRRRELDAIEAARGAFRDYPGPSTDEMLRLSREEEREAEERKFGLDSGAGPA